MPISNVPIDSSNERQHRRQIALAVNWLLNNVLYLTYEGTTPVGNILPSFVGQNLLLDDGGTMSWWRSIGTDDTDWLKISN